VKALSRPARGAFDGEAQGRKNAPDRSALGSQLSPTADLSPPLSPPLPSLLFFTTAYGPTRTPAINIPPSSPGATKAALAAAALATGTPARGGASVGVSPPGPTTPLAAGPAGAAGEASPAARRAARPARAGPRLGAAGKIDGLDYYEYVELIRASSL
jgi:hypothetical protein